MANLNKVFLIGNVTRDLELRYTPQGTAVLDVPLAVNDYSKGKETTTYIDVTFWDKRAETLGKHAGKGSPLFIEGKLKLERWEGKDGKSYSKLKVTGWDFQFLGQKQDEQHPLHTPPPPVPQPARTQAEVMGLGEGSIPF